jgi:hypothetical protein
MSFVFASIVMAVVRLPAVCDLRPPRTNMEKADAVALKLVSWVAQNGLSDGFFFRVEADDMGMLEVLEA